MEELEKKDEARTKWFHENKDRKEKEGVTCELWPTSVFPG